MKENLKIVYVALADLKIAPFNPKNHNSKQFARLSKSIETYDWSAPIIVSKNTGNVIDGNQRLKFALKKHGSDFKVPVVYLDVDLEQEKKLIIAFNNTSTETDEEKMYELVAALQSDDFLADIKEEMEKEQKKQEEDVLTPEYNIVRDADEAYDYILFITRASLDFLNIQDFFDLKQVYDLNRKHLVGIGRTLEGKDLLKLVEFARKNGINSINDL